MHFQIALIAIAATVAVGAVLIPIVREEWKLAQEQVRQQREQAQLAKRGVRVSLGKEDDDEDAEEYKDAKSGSMRRTRSSVGSLRKRSGYQLVDEHDDKKLRHLSVLSDSERFVLKNESDIESPIYSRGLVSPSSIPDATTTNPLLPHSRPSASILSDEQSGVSTPTIKVDSRGPSPSPPTSVPGSENEGTVPLFSPAPSAPGTPAFSEGGEWDIVSSSGRSDEGAKKATVEELARSRTGSEAGWEHL